MSEKPSYLGLLNAIVIAESNAYAYLTAWADLTSDPEVETILRKIAAREGEHGMTFARRINELGFSVQEAHDPKFHERMEIATSDRSDIDKIAALGLLDFCVEDGPDVFDGFFKDHSIDIATGELLGRYIAEERDTLRLIQGCQRQLQSSVSV